MVRGILCSVSWAVISVSFFCTLSSAREVTKINLDPRSDIIEGTDSSAGCSSASFCPSFYLKVEFEGGEAKAAKFTEGEEFTFTKDLVLNEKEIAGIEFVRDSFNRAWIKKMNFSSRMIHWATVYNCRLYLYHQKPVKEVATQSMSFMFDTEGLGEEVLLSNSTCEIATGKFKDKEETPFWIPFRMTQRNTLRGK